MNTKPVEASMYYHGKDTKHEQNRMFEIKHVKFPFPILVLIKIAMIWEIFMIHCIWQTMIMMTYIAFFNYAAADATEDSFLTDLLPFDTSAETLLFVLDTIYLLDIIARLAVEVWRVRSHVYANNVIILLISC